MAFEDGMLAISKALKVVGAVLALCALAFSVTQLQSWLLGTVAAVIVYALLWTPAWIVRKFIQ